MKEIIDKILCNSGYLPPRNEEEMIAFESVYSKVKIKKGFHLNVDKIVEGSCPIRVVAHTYAEEAYGSSNKRIAVRNCRSLAQYIMTEKIKTQHKG